MCIRDRIFSGATVSEQIQQLERACRWDARGHSLHLQTPLVSRAESQCGCTIHHRRFLVCVTVPACTPFYVHEVTTILGTMKSVIYGIVALASLSSKVRRFLKLCSAFSNRRFLARGPAAVLSSIEHGPCKAVALRSTMSCTRPYSPATVLSWQVDSSMSSVVTHSAC